MNDLDQAHLDRMTDVRWWWSVKFFVGALAAVIVLTLFIGSGAFGKTSKSLKSAKVKSRPPLSNPAQVRLWYREYLKKEPDDRTVAKWSYLFRIGKTQQQVLNDILTTEGYYRDVNRLGDMPPTQPPARR